MLIIKIERGSQAWEYLTLALAAEDARIVRIADDEGDFKIKVNEYTWSPALSTTREVER